MSQQPDREVELVVQSFDPAQFWKDAADTFTYDLSCIRYFEERLRGAKALLESHLRDAADEARERGIEIAANEGFRAQIQHTAIQCGFATFYDVPTWTFTLNGKEYRWLLPHVTPLELRAAFPDQIAKEAKILCVAADGRDFVGDGDILLLDNPKKPLVLKVIAK